MDVHYYIKLTSVQASYGGSYEQAASYRRYMWGEDAFQGWCTTL